MTQKEERFARQVAEAKEVINRIGYVLAGEEDHEDTSGFFYMVVDEAAKSIPFVAAAWTQIEEESEAHERDCTCACHEGFCRVTAAGEPTNRRFEPFTPESIARFEECAADGSATALLMLDVAKLPEEEQDAAQDKLLADGMLRMEYEHGEEAGTRATGKAIEAFVREGQLEYMTGSNGQRGTRRPGGNGNWVALTEP
jgi:hypothetical protein